MGLPGRGIFADIVRRESSGAVIPDWLHTLAIAALVLAGVCALVILIDVLRHPQHMRIITSSGP
jgi:aspartokinase-like uncharacterized kinase